MKHFFFLFATLALCLTASADSYKVLSTNSSDIRVNNKPIKVGDTFKDTDIITWTQNQQAIKVYNFTAKRQEILVARGVSKQRTQSASDILASTHHLSTHAPGMAETDFARLVQAIEGEYYLLDEIEIETDVEFSHGKAIIVSYNMDDGMYEAQATIKGSRIIMNRELFKAGKSVSRDLIINIDLVTEDDNGKPSNTTVKHGVKMHILPFKL